MVLGALGCMNNTDLKEEEEEE
jgi:hypothetical protein